MDLAIKIDEYLSPEEIKSIVSNEIRARIAKDSERILSNLGYTAAFAIIDSAMTAEQLDAVRAKAVEVCHKVSESSVFRSPNVWDREASPAYKVINDTINDCRPIIIARVKEAIAAYSFAPHINANNNEYLAEALIDALRIGLNK